MSTPQKVMNAVVQARRSQRVDDVVFDTVNGNGFFVTFNGNRILEFDSSQESNNAKLALNNAISPILASIKSNYLVKMNSEL